MNCPRGPRVGKYRVDVESFERTGVRALEEAIDREGCIVIDEIGKMELCSKGFPQIVMQVFDSDHPVLATIPLFKNPFLNQLRARDDVALIELTATNRDELPDRLIGTLMRDVGS